MCLWAFMWALFYLLQWSPHDMGDMSGYTVFFKVHLLELGKISSFQLEDYSPDYHDIRLDISNYQLYSSLSDNYQCSISSFRSSSSPSRLIVQCSCDSQLCEIPANICLIHPDIVGFHQPWNYSSINTIFINGWSSFR